MKLAIVGGRDYNDYDEVKDMFSNTLGILHILHMKL